MKFTQELGGPEVLDFHQRGGQGRWLTTDLDYQWWIYLPAGCGFLVTTRFFFKHVWDRESQAKPSFVTVIGWGLVPNCEPLLNLRVFSLAMNHWPNTSLWTLPTMTFFVNPFAISTHLCPPQNLTWNGQLLTCWNIFIGLHCAQIDPCRWRLMKGWKGHMQMQFLY